ncbi:MAG: DUF1801 domain-containing protein [Crocinitomicaceae bacterium]|jgi:uncharacterized protein YdhG (YjbR/CyaY superfamily)|nr:DUF1801 domain-containing protein [Crocinitomicaceae bacterium]
MAATKFETVEAYILQFEKGDQKLLNEVRSFILKISPEIVEKIAYGMPGYQFKKKPLVYFALYKNHFGFYATPNTHEEFTEKLKPYKQGKGSVQFPLDTPLPFDLMEQMIRFRMHLIENNLGY